SEDGKTKPRRRASETILSMVTASDTGETLLDSLVRQTGIRFVRSPVGESPEGSRFAAAPLLIHTRPFG
ncbi:MAG: hypothetical protein OEW47_10695, partial [Thermoleophilia bacterium]|nr:hypothetical protein [Thermoleophilia bacterium]